MHRSAVQGVVVGNPKGATATTPQAHPPPDVDAWMFRAPDDIICPISLSVFLDPVLTSTGYAYERTYIEQHFLNHSTDPMTGVAVLNKSLTPVYPLKSRALEYRETVARACLEKACTPGVHTPVIYLRRAVELAAGAGFRLHGLSPEAESYIASHPSNAYDRLALDVFATGLLEDGYRDKAAAVFFHLLATDGDRTHQASLIRRCLACWSGDGSATPPMIEAGGGGAGDRDPHVYEKLVQLFNRSGAPAFGWIQVIDVAAVAGLSEEFTARLCETVLFPPMPPAGSDPAAHPALPWDSEKQILLKYVQTLTTGLKKRHQGVDTRVRELEKRAGVGASDRGLLQGRHKATNLSTTSLAGSILAGEVRVTRPRWLSHPALIVALAVVSVVGDERSVWVRGAHALPLLALLPEGA